MILSKILLFFNVILLSLIIITATIQDQIDQLSKNDQEKVLKTLLSTSILKDALVDKAENWCCKIDPGVDATSATRQTTIFVEKYGRHKCGYADCGVFGWGRCTRWCSETWIEAEQHVDTYLYYTQRSCPDIHLTCCEQHMYILGHCFSFTEIYNNQEILPQLNELGIVIPGPSIG